MRSFQLDFVVDKIMQSPLRRLSISPRSAVQRRRTFYVTKLQFQKSFLPAFMLS
jgi:hypothetical protein